MLNWLDEQVQEQRRNDTLREVERRRLVAAALAGRPAPTRFYYPALVRLGCWLVAWGRSLQARHSAVVEPAIVSQTRDTVLPC